MSRVAVRARWAGWLLCATLGAVLALNVAWVARHHERLRPISPGDVAPLFELPRLDREGRQLAGTLALASLRGRVVVVDFWAEWCKPCRDSIPALERVYRAYRERGLELVSVKTDGPELGRAAERIASTSFPLVLDEGDVAALYKVSSIPHLVLIDRLGVIRYVHRGEVDPQKLGAQIEALLE